MTHPTEEAVRAIAEGLTEAQRKYIREPLRYADPNTIRAVERRGIIARRTCFPDGRGLVFTELGLAVRAHLQQEGRG